MKSGARVGISRIALTVALIVLVVGAGVAIYLTSKPAGPSTTASSSTSESSTLAASLNVTMIPPSPLVAPGQTQNYSLIEVQATGSGLSGTIAVRAFAPPGLSLLLNQTSVSLSATPQPMPVMLRADPGLSPGKYKVTVEASSSFSPADNQTFTIDVVPMLVIMQNLAFHPQNITVAKGTSVTWLNLDSTIGCCDPGNHDISFTSGANATSPILTRFESWTYTFGADEVVDYFCTIHPFMKGQVTVTG